MANKRIDQPTGTSTVGHEWDGIEELDTPLPRWWLWTFYLTIAFSVGYVNMAAFVILAGSAVFLAPVGAAIAHKLNANHLRKVFAIALFFLGANMVREAVFGG